MALFTFTSAVEILDYVDKNHMNTHYFRCSDLNNNNNNNNNNDNNNNNNNNNRKIKHYTSFFVGSVNK